MNRVHNFSAGPAALPIEVLEKAQSEITDYHGAGTSIMEQSHRGAQYTEVDTQAKARLSRILNLSDDFEILFLQGGASTQFFTVPQNLLFDGKTADYINTGTWSKKAIAEAKRFGDINEAFSSADSNFSRVPTSDELKLNSDAAYVHFTSNNTIFGTQFPTEPETNGVPLVCDASSDFLSRPIDMPKYGIIYAGAQKNLGPSGVTVVIIRRDILEQVNPNIPSMVNYNTHVGTLFNTPPTFAVYMVNLVLEWIEDKGGISYFEQYNKEKAGALYEVIDNDDFYRGTVENASRSNMNVTFRLPTEDLEAEFLREAAEYQLVALKGHRSVGGVRASIYNACSRESVDALADFMNHFRSKHG